MMLGKSDDDRCLNPDSLWMDEACFTVINERNSPVTLYSIAADCYMCDGLPWRNLTANSNITLLLNTRYSQHIYYTAHQMHWCHSTFSFKQYGHYGWNLTNSGCSSIYTLIQPPDPYAPLYIPLLICLAVIAYVTVTPIVVRTARRLWVNEQTDVHSDLEALQQNDSPPLPPMRISKSSTRTRALDTFRGITILLMIFVNNGGGEYLILNHSPWNGLTIADLVLPWFAWAMGVTIAITMRTQLRMSLSRGKIILRCLRRSLILILLGLTINSRHVALLSEIRFPGVLQLLGIAYFVCATIETLFMKAQRSFQDSLLQYGRFMFLEDIADSWAQWIIICALVVMHTLLTFLLPVPGCPTGYLGPGGYHLRGKYENCTAGAAGYVDRLLLGSHIYWRKNNPVYGPTLPHDPEGIMNTLSAILIVYMGVQAGRIMLTYYQGNARIYRWFMWFLLTGLVAGALCNFSKEEGIIPVNKNMMSLSYVLATSSLAFLLYAVLYALIDYRQFWSGAPFIYAGMNPITLYMGHYLTMGLFPWEWKMATVTHTSLLLMNSWTTILWALVAYGLYKKDVILTV